MKPTPAILAGVFVMLTSLRVHPAGVPQINEVRSYQVELRFAGARSVPRDRVDRLLTAIGKPGGLKSWPENTTRDCVLLPYADVRVALLLTNKTEVSLWLARDGSFLSLAEGAYTPVVELTRSSLRAFVAAIESDLRRELQSARKPLRYRVGALDDVRTLQDAALLFYDDRSRWRLLYDANRKRVSDPDYLPAGVQLRIPRAPATEPNTAARANDLPSTLRQP